MDLSDAKLDRLLAGKDRLSVGEKEEILENVLAQVARTESAPARLPRTFPRWAFAALAVLLAVPAALLLRRDGRDRAFTARGGSGGAPAVETSCIGRGGPGTCALGDKLVFKVAPGRFRAFAAVALAPDGTTFWYFPNDASARSVDLSVSSRSGILEQALTLDARHVSGDYVLYGVFSSDPLTREQVRDAIRGPAGPELVIVKRRLRIEERRTP